jgi:integrase
MGRPANPSPVWDSDRKIWTVRITVKVNGPQEWHDLPDIPEDQADVAKLVAKGLSDRLRRGAAVRPGEGETITLWSARWLKDRNARGISSVKDDEGRMRKHVLPVLGAYPIATITRDQIESVVEDLDRKIGLEEGDEDALGWKTAQNTWMLVTKMFDDAVNAKKRDLRARSDNPCKGIKGPETGDRKAKQYLYPNEFSKLMAADVAKVPLSHKTMYAAAVYTYLRAGELEAVEWDDVDLVHNVIQVTKAIDRKTGKPKSTKSGETRRIPIEPALCPLLQRLRDEARARLPRGKTELKGRVLWMPKDDERATGLRVHLLAAGVTRADLHKNDAHRKHLTFHDLRATGITWAAVRGDDPLKIKQRAGHASFSTTEQYVREAENLGRDFGDPFPELPPELTGGHTGGPGSSSPGGGSFSSKPRKHRETRGADGDRTRDLMHAMHALSQLSYGPKRDAIRTSTSPFCPAIFHAPPVEQNRRALRPGAG